MITTLLKSIHNFSEKIADQITSILIPRIFGVYLFYSNKNLFNLGTLKAIESITHPNNKKYNLYLKERNIYYSLDAGISFIPYFSSWAIQLLIIVTIGYYGLNFIIYNWLEILIITIIIFHNTISEALAIFFQPLKNESNKEKN